MNALLEVIRHLLSGLRGEDHLCMYLFLGERNSRAKIYSFYFTVRGFVAPRMLYCKPKGICYPAWSTDSPLKTTLLLPVSCVSKGSRVSMLFPPCRGTFNTVFSLWDIPKLYSSPDREVCWGLRQWKDRAESSK